MTLVKPLVSTCHFMLVMTGILVVLGICFHIFLSMKEADREAEKANNNNHHSDSDLFI